MAVALKAYPSPHPTTTDGLLVKLPSFHVMRQLDYTTHIVKG